VSALRRQDRFPRVVAWVRKQRTVDLFLSVISVGEVEKSIERQRTAEPAFADTLASWLDWILWGYGDRILPFDLGSAMIKSFRNDAAEAAWARRFIKGVPNDITKVAYRKLMQIHNARTIDDLRAPPGNRLESLTGDRKGQHSIRINDQWRVCFRWRDGDAYDVEIVDYH
jgi:proteic killer suppression protein